MVPMFRQIEAHEIANILNIFEKNDFDNADLETLWDSLKTKTDFLFIGLKEELV